MGLRLLKSFVSSTLILGCWSMLLLHQGLASTRPSGNDTDRQALLDIKAKITHDPMLITSSWNDSLHFCHWKGVLCGRRHQRATGLRLYGYNLAGTISPSIGNLSFLRIAHLYNNSFQGEIPHEIGQLFRLQELWFSHNMLEGHIPMNLSHCSNMWSLRLHENRFTGNIPKEISSLFKLRELVILSNNLTGAIPHSFGNLSSLERFWGGHNMLEGTIPETLGNLKRLIEIVLPFNKLSGMIPPSIYNLTLLKMFEVVQNQFQGSLPQNLGLTLPNLEWLNFEDNQFSGSIPLSISNASKLEFLDLSLNNFSHELGVNFGNLNNFWGLSLYDSGLGTGGADDLNFISTLVNCSKLRYLDILDNNFGGVLPNSIGNLSIQLQYLLVGNNQIFGSIPGEIGNFANLNALAMHSNQLTGSIPTTFGRLHNLQGLDLRNNKLSGEIPSTIGNLTLLTELRLSENDFQGDIPAGLGNCQSLTVLVLNGNNLSGSIPPEVIGLSSISRMLDLSRNSLTGLLPLEVGNLRNLVLLNLSHNKLSGEIPSTLGSCTDLLYLHLENNSFGGSIPQSMATLQGMEDLELSHNNFSGEIPKFLASFLLLKNLNLSFNDLEGEVPVRGVFQNVSAISVLGNYKLCGGIPALQLPACPPIKTRKKKMSLGLALIIPIVCGVSGIILVSSILILRRLRKMRNQPSVGTSSMIFSRNISYQQILKATNGFSAANLIGTGSFGSVYKGILQPSDQKAIAVKVLNQQRRGVTKSFMAECKALRNIRHRNLVKIISACASVDFQGNDFKALVYEFMENGSLESWLHPVLVLPPTSDAQEQPRSLSLLQRLGIAIDVAFALDYLHNRCHIPVVHCDIKPCNILLDGEMTAHVGDFGIARLLQQNNNSELSQSQTSSVGIRGTMGYAAPEYGMGNDVSTNGDVYSYGILLLEMFTGKRPTDGMFKDGLNLHKVAKMALSENVIEIVDRELLEEEEGAGKNFTTRMTREKIHDSLIIILRTGVACSEQLPKERMTIVDAARELHSAKEMLLGRRT